MFGTVIIFTVLDFRNFSFVYQIYNIFFIIVVARNITFNMIILAVYIVAAGVKNNNEMSIGSVMSILITLFSHCCFTRLTREHIENVLTDSQLEYLDIPNGVLNVALKLNYYRMKIYSGMKTFEVGGKEISLKKMRDILSLLCSNKSDRILIDEWIAVEWVLHLVSVL